MIASFAVIDIGGKFPAYLTKVNNFPSTYVTYICLITLDPHLLSLSDMLDSLSIKRFFSFL